MRFAVVLIVLLQVTAIFSTLSPVTGPVVNPVFPFDGVNTPEPAPYVGPEDPVSAVELWLGYWLMTPYGVMMVPGER